jgi:zinc D-Ala-D-Ala carboxypeptidase
MSIKVSEHLTLGEATISGTAKSLGINNTPSKDVLEVMKHTAVNIFEKVRAHFGGRPIYVSSFYRAPEVNKAIGGSATSQHCKGEAMDLDGDVYENASNKQIFEFIRDNLQFDQLITEGVAGGKIAWVHVSLKKTGNRKQISFMYKSSGKTVYEPYTAQRYKQLVY